jgi:acyl-coenzyme A thioesterase PaaI-like protein
MQFMGSHFVGQGFGLTFTKHDDGYLRAGYTFSQDKQGPPPIVHGGAQASVLDEAMTAAVFDVDLLAFTVNLTVDYKAPVYINVPVTIQGKLERREGRKLYLSGQIVLADGTIATQASALFIVVASPE